MRNRRYPAAGLLAATIAAGGALSAPAQAATVPDGAERSVVTVSVGKRTGTGVAWSPTLIVTSERIVGDEDDASVVTADGRVLSAEVEGSSDGLSLLSVEDSGLRAVRKGKVAGDTMNAVVVSGPVGYSEPGRDVTVTRRRGALTVRGRLASAATGAPVLDARGRLLGVVTTRVPGGARAATVAGIGDAAANADEGSFLSWKKLAAVLLLIALLATVTALVLRRRRERERRSRARTQARERGTAAHRVAVREQPPHAPPPPPPPPPGQPWQGEATTAVLPGPGSTPAPPDDDEDDFEVVLRTPRDG